MATDESICCTMRHMHYLLSADSNPSSSPYMLCNCMQPGPSLPYAASVGVELLL